MVATPRGKSKVIALTHRAIAVAARTVHLDMKRGITGLATIASTAPFVGLLGTVLGIMNAFRGVDGQRDFVRAAITRGISEALVTTAFGLLVAVPAAWFYNYLASRMELFDIETKSASLELLTLLTVHQEQPESTQRHAPADPQAP
jgi:biopolymer transport protein ExbB/TolQ